MSAHTKIEWAHHSVNFWWGCTKVSPACEHCYAEVMAKLFSRGTATWGMDGLRRMREGAAVRELQALDASAGRRGQRARVFINSMSDTFEDRSDLNVARQLLFDAANALTHIDLLLLTKRPENIRSMVPSGWLHGFWPDNVWMGTTVEDQRRADERIALLLKVPARVRFLSCEPLLGPIEIGSALESLSWVICGGESGGKARPMRHAWAALLRDQCLATGVPFFFKQWGEWAPARGDLPPARVVTSVMVEGRQRRFVDDGDEIHVRVGKAEAGRSLDGRIWSEIPMAKA